ncbi:hypothetical protein DL98DRAFT_124738 [Cadophora sp. DSE1049]|nr:hypothetical protein DL98DRAFT_124738 [Cadophora sp. DSE1049]
MRITSLDLNYGGIFVRVLLFPYVLFLLFPDLLLQNQRLHYINTDKDRNLGSKPIATSITCRKKIYKQWATRWDFPLLNKIPTRRYHYYYE